MSVFVVTWRRFKSRRSDLSSQSNLNRRGFGRRTRGPRCWQIFQLSTEMWIHVCWGSVDRIIIFWKSFLVFRAIMRRLLHNLTTNGVQATMFMMIFLLCEWMQHVFFIILCRTVSSNAFSVWSMVVVEVMLINPQNRYGDHFASC